MNQETCCRHVIYHGRVQGVGFRVTTAHLAQRFPVAGWVRNLPDGTVELLAQGKPQMVDAFLASVVEQFRANLTQIDELSAAQTSDITGFTVRQ